MTTKKEAGAAEGGAAGRGRPGPDFREIAEVDAMSADFPVKTEREYRVCIDEEPYRRMKAHAATTDEVELCGVLLGDVCRDARGFFLKITAIIEGEGANNHGTEVTFTQQTWSHINKIKDAQYPHRKIVGWYHTHPGFGVFLSQRDCFIQENFFNQPFQVAIVIETKQQVEGCFAWVNGRSEPLRRYWTGTREVALATNGADVSAPGGTAVAEAAGSQAAVAQKPRWAPVLMGVTLILCGVLLGRLLGVAGSQQALESYESEVYSLMEMAAFSQLMKSDLQEMREGIGTLAGRPGARADADLGRGLATIAGQIDRELAICEKRRHDYRGNLEKLAQVKQSMFGRVTELEQRQSRSEAELTEMMAAFAFVEFQRTVVELAKAGGGRIDLQALTPEQKIKLQGDVERVLRLAPAGKSAIEQMIPGLLNALDDMARGAKPQGLGAGGR